MNHFVKSLWLGALASPPCWKCALKRNPFMCLVFVIPLFLLCGIYNVIPLLAICWVIGMVLFIITPRNRFKLEENGKTLYFFCYDTYSKWNLSVSEQNRDAILRVFIKENGKLKKAYEPLVIGGFDDSLMHLGFFLVKSRYSEWRLWGNRFNDAGKPMLLGRKIANYVFLSTKKREPAYFIHGKTVVILNYDGIQKLDKIFYDEESAIYKEIESYQEGTIPPFYAKEKNGCFILMEYKKVLQLYKVVNGLHTPAAYLVYTPWFSTSILKKDNYRVYKQHDTFGYIATTNI